MHPFLLCGTCTSIQAQRLEPSVVSGRSTSGGQGAMPYQGATGMAVYLATLATALLKAVGSRNGLPFGYW